MVDALLLISYVNLLALLPLYSARRLAENLYDLKDPGFFERLVMAPEWMCLAVCLASLTIAWRLAGPGPDRKWHRRAVIGNSLIMILIWVIPPILKISPWSQSACFETWTIVMGLLLLVTSLSVPFTVFMRAVGWRASK